MSDCSFLDEQGKKPETQIVGKHTASMMAPADHTSHGASPKDVR